MYCSLTRDYRVLIACILTGLLLPFQSMAQWVSIGNATGMSAAASSFNHLVISSGKYYVSYYDLDVIKASVQQYDGSNWSYVGNQGITSSFAIYSDLAVAGDEVYYSFQDNATNGQASILKYDGSTWNYLVQGLSPSIINMQSLARSASGDLYYCYNVDGALTVQHFDGTTWSQLGNAGFTSGTTPVYLKIVAGNNDSIYVSGVSNGKAEVFKIHGTNGGTWELLGNANFDATSSEQFLSSMAIDASNRIYLAYTGLSATGNKLSVRRYENGVWSVLGTENFTTGRLAYVSIAVTPAGEPFVAFQDWDIDQKLTVMRYNQTGWEKISTANLSSGVASFTSLAMDVDDKPVVAFSDNGYDKTVVLKYTGDFSSSVTDVEVTTSGNVPPEITTDNGTIQLEASVLPAESDQTVNWTIRNVTGDATVSAAGLVTANGNGTVWVKATSLQDATKSDSILITISNQYTPYESLSGIIRKSSLWLKANTVESDKIVYGAGQNIASWRNELSDYTVTSPSTGQQPLFVDNTDSDASFNFNPSVKFNASAQQVLKLESAGTDILGTNGTLFLVVNTYGGANTSSTCLAYQGSVDQARYQVKADFRVQTGGLNSAGNTSGYTSDFDNTNFVYPESSGRLLSSVGAGASFYTRRNGVTVGVTINDDPNYIPAVNLGLCVGSNSNYGGTEYSNTAIAEVMTFTTPLTADSIGIVESYLGVKYGLTLVGTNYQASGSEVIWDATNNATYHHNITGIGRDDAFYLVQKQSHSAESSALLYLYNGGTQGNFPAMNVSNTNDFNTDKSYLVAGDNNGDTAFSACYTARRLPHMSRVWKVQKTGVVDSVTVALDQAVVPATLTKLLVSSGDGFADSDTHVYQLKSSNGKLYYTLPLQDGEFFTFAADSVVASLSVTDALCAGQPTGTIATTFTGGAAPYTFDWNSTPAQHTADLSNVGGGDYTLQITDAGGCTISYQATVAENEKIQTSVTTTAARLCADMTATLNVTSDNSTLTSYAWNPGNENTAVVTVAPAATTKYYVTGTDTKGCTYIDSVTVEVSSPISVAPVLSLVSQEGGSATFTWSAVAGATGYIVSTDGGLTYTTPTDGATATSHIVTNIAPGKTITLQVKATGDLDCQQSEWSNVVSALYMVSDLFVPNAFTPNGDGRNDELRVFGSAVQAMELDIFNQWGQLIFRSNNQATGWNGTVNGQAQPAGVYMYVLKATLADGTQQTLKGAINLVR